MIQYKFAYDSRQNVVDIQTLSKENKTGDFTCLGCGNGLIPALGEKNEHHFRHKFILEDNCSNETYLHKLAKIKFYETYDKCLKDNKPFNIQMETYITCDFYENQFKRVCNINPILPTMSTFELTQSFKRIDLECKEDSFIPDILLEDPDNQQKIFFEVVVTHPCSHKKISSNYMIIEFKIDSEKDIEEIESCLIKQSKKIKFINFNRKLKFNYCNGQCHYRIIPSTPKYFPYNIFVVYKDGESDFISDLNLYQIDSLQSKILHFEYVENNLSNKNCFSCIHHIPNQSLDTEGTISCPLLRKTGNSNMGANCRKFSADPHGFGKYKYINYKDIQKHDHPQEPQNYDYILEDDERWFK